MTYDDPFSLVYKSIWDCVNGNEHVTSLVKPKNKIRLDLEQHPIKPNVSDSDLPEILLIPDGASVNIRATSSGTKVTRRFAWVITTGQTLLCERILPVEFALIRAMKSWPDTIAQATWNNKRFITRVDLGEVAEGESDAERNRGIRGWSALMNIQVEMIFQTEDL